eukprot:4399881-Prymnesium_polylepis.1
MPCPDAYPAARLRAPAAGQHDRTAFPFCFWLLRGVRVAGRGLGLGARGSAIRFGVCAVRCRKGCGLYGVQ